MAQTSLEISSLRRDVEAMGSLPLLPLDDFVEYSDLCQRILGRAAEISAPSATRDGDDDAGTELRELGLALRRAGDGLAAAEVLECAGAYARVRHDARVASSSYNSAGKS